MKIVIENQESCYLHLLCAIKAEIKMIRAYKRLKIVSPMSSDAIGNEETTAPIY